MEACWLHTLLENFCKDKGTLLKMGRKIDLIIGLILVSV